MPHFEFSVAGAYAGGHPSGKFSGGFDWVAGAYAGGNTVVVTTTVAERVAGAYAGGNMASPQKFGS